MQALLSEPVQALVIINVILTLALLFPFVAGVWSLGLPGFMCLGAYVGAYLTVDGGASLPVAIVAASLAGGLGSLPIGLLALRVRGIHLAIATLAAAELITLFFSHFEPLGAVAGYTGMPYLAVPWMAGVLALVIALSVAIYRSRLGTALIATGSDPTVAACNGIAVPMMQLTALVIGGALAGLAGALYAHYYSFIAPNNFGFDRTITILLFLVTGGFTPLGAVVGASLLTLLPQYIKGLEAWAPAMYGVIVIVVMAILPDGLLPKNRIGRLRRRRRAGPPAPDAPPARAADSLSSVDG